MNRTLETTCKRGAAKCISLLLFAGPFLALATTCCGAAAFDFNDVRAMASRLAAEPYQSPTNQISPALTNLSYVEYKAIEFIPEKARWRDEHLPFALEFFHPGYLHGNSVRLHEIVNGTATEIPFDPALYNYGTNHLALSSNLGFPGFRIVTLADNFGEVAVFLGASYFRMLGRGQIFGTSARGIALDTTNLERKEEFPAFEQFWIRKPHKKDRQISVYALMNGPSIAGAYSFDIRPGTSTVARVHAVLFPRKQIRQFGVAPLTSMFLHGDNRPMTVPDFRPEVHDADGLLMNNARGEWIWHPLEAGKMMRVNAFQDESLQGFGLIQRDRDFEHYQDLVAGFQRRPNAWVRPRGNWGRGAVELVQFPSEREFFDNVSAFWVPAQPPEPGKPLELEYDLTWSQEEPDRHGLGFVAASRFGRVIVDPPKDPPNLRFVIDFGGPSLKAIDRNERITSQSDFGPGVKFVADSILKNEINGTWRLVIEIEEPKKAADISACLKFHNQTITETWNYTWQP